MSSSRARSTRLRFQPRRYEASQYDLSRLRTGRTNNFNEGFGTALRVREQEGGPPVRLPEYSRTEERRILENTLDRLKEFDSRRATRDFDPTIGIGPRNRNPEVRFSRQEVERVGLYRLIDMAFNTSMRPSEQLLLRVEWEGQRPVTGPRVRFNADEADVDVTRRSRQEGGTLFTKRLTLTEGNYRDVIRRLASVDVETEWTSDAQAVLRLLEQTNYTSVVFEKKKVRDRSGNLQQGFWRWTSKLEGFDLSRYQVFHSVQATNYSSNCFIHCLETAFTNEHGVISEEDQTIISRARMFIRNRVIAQQHMKKIANFSKMEIRVLKPGQKQSNGTLYRPESDRPIRELSLGVIDKHAFLNEEVPFTMWALKHYHDLMIEHRGDVNAFRYMTSANGHEDPSRACDSYNALKYMYDYEILHPFIVSRLNEASSSAFVVDELKSDNDFIQSLKKELPHFISNTNLEAILQGVSRNRFAHYMQRITATVSRPDNHIEININ